MAGSVNKVFLMGNLTRDPQVRFTPGGTAVAEIGLAVNRRYLDKQSNQWKDEVTFVDVTLWGRTAEVAGEYLTKGRQVFIEGRLQLDSWDDKETGQKRSKMRVVCENMTMVGGGGGQGQSGGGGRPAGAGRGAPQAGPDSGFDSGSFEPDYGGGGSAPQDEVPF